ncbi:MAG TPA: helix-turn-helix domain-containing protein [Puia sp.]|nr:helix-turn-helix domain-containing protein [Puia sp.]
MRFDKFIPADKLKPYIKYLVLSESTSERTYKVFPSTGMVIGFQYKGKLSHLKDDVEAPLMSAGITGIADRYKVFKESADIGTVLVFFTEIGLAHFTACPANELFNASISLDNIFSSQAIRETEEKLSLAGTDRQRIDVVEHFLLKQLKEIQRDQLVVEAVKLIYESKGTIRIIDLNRKLLISQSPLEKRFRKLVGTTPKKFASIVRFNTVLNAIDKVKSLTDICYENHFFDQAHFIKDFRQYTGDTPENFKRFS